MELKDVNTQKLINELVRRGKIKHRVQRDESYEIVIWKDGENVMMKDTWTYDEIKKGPATILEI